MYTRQTRKDVLKKRQRRKVRKIRRWIGLTRVVESGRADVPKLSAGEEALPWSEFFYFRFLFLINKQLGKEYGSFPRNESNFKFAIYYSQAQWSSEVGWRGGGAGERGGVWTLLVSEDRWTSLCLIVQTRQHSTTLVKSLSSLFAASNTSPQFGLLCR